MILILDCDNTLYPASTNMMALNDAGIARYLTETMGLEKDEAERVRLGFLRKYGTTLAGLIAEHNVNADEFMALVHNYDVSPFVKPNPKLKSFLCTMNIPRVVLTSANEDHALRVADALGVRGCLDRIYDLKAVDYLGKPHPHAYEKILDDYPGERAVFVDDRMLNFPAAHKLGMVNVWVDEGYKPKHGSITPALSVFTDEARELASQASEIVDFTIKHIGELADIWPEVVAKANGK
jgi:putative hydrolase of the HAD superfamily